METEILTTAITVLSISLSVTFLVFFILATIRFISRQKIKNNRKNLKLLKVTLPRYPRPLDSLTEKVQKEQINEQSAEQMFSELRGIVPDDLRRFFRYGETISMEIVATAESISFFIYCSPEFKDSLKRTIYGTHPEAEIVEVNDYFDEFTKDPFVYGYIRLAGPAYAPIRTYETLGGDTLNTLLAKLTDLHGKEKIAIQFYSTPVGDSWRSSAHSALRTATQTAGDINNTVLSGGQDRSIIDNELYSGIEKKMSKKGFLTGIRIISVAENKQTATTNLQSVGKVFAQYELPPMTQFETTMYKINTFNFLRDFKLRIKPFFDLPIYRQQFITNTAELATLFHLPSVEVRIPKLEWQRYKKEPAPADIPQEGLFLGYNTYRGERKKIFIKEDDRRRHFYIIGQTGVGKSEYMKQMFLQDVYSGKGCCFIDPHGDVAEDILFKIPGHRKNDVVYWDPGDTQYPMGLNIMDVEGDEAKNIIINSFIDLLYKLYDPNRVGMMGPMLERTIRNVMLTAMEEPGSTLIEALRLITNPEYAKTKIPNIKDPIVKTYWTEQMAQTTDFHRSEALGYYVSKFDRSITDKTIRNIIGQSKSSFNFRQIMDEQKILIVNLSKGSLGIENMTFLGMVLIPRILVSAMSRANIPEPERKDFYLYVDEFQNFTTNDFVSILSEARKYRLSLVMGNQYISQIREDIRNAIFGNVGTLGAFRVGIDDAKYLAPFYHPIVNEFDLSNNAIGNMYIKLLVEGRPSEAFTVAYDWNEIQAIPRNEQIANDIIARTRRDIAKEKSLVEQEIVTRANLI
ncbi:MAG TPA: TraM recognition domain-containing protein [Candidatus Dojkabacteria bacterium]|nr:TraM recognition domain-containing protein [Candidatus Dojkabacteria bacterium]